MNQANRSTALATATDAPEYLPAPASTAGLGSLMLHPQSLESMMTVAQMMAAGKVAMPRHLHGNVGDCLAIVMQATQWNMSPFAIAAKTFISPNGTLGYEGTLWGAVLSESGALEGDLRYEFIGDWSKVLGKFEKRESKPKPGQQQRDPGEPKFYIVATYGDKDEEGLGVIARGRLRGEKEDREVTLMMKQCFPRFSTQWANNPQQQIIYAVNRVWSRRHKPSVMLGVHSEEDVGAIDERGPKDMGEVEYVVPDELLKAAKAAAEGGLDTYAAFWRGLGLFERGLLNEKTDTHEGLKKRAEEVDKAKGVKPKATSAPTPAATPAPTSAPDPKTGEVAPPAASGPTWASIMERMHAAEKQGSAIGVELAGEDIELIESDDQRQQLVAERDRILATMQKGGAA